MTECSPACVRPAVHLQHAVRGVVAMPVFPGPNQESEVILDSLILVWATGDPVPQNTEKTGTGNTRLDEIRRERLDSKKVSLPQLRFILAAQLIFHPR